MDKFLCLGLLLGSLAACESDIGEPAPADDCDAALHAGLIGQNIDFLDVPLDAMARLIGPDTMVTMDYIPERLNIYFDENDIITDVRCG